MRSIRKLALMGVAAFLMCAAVASSASALEAYNQTTGVKLAVGTAVTGTTTGNSTLSGTFFGFPVTVTCTHSTVTGEVEHNAFAPDTVVSGTIQTATWSGCSSSFKNPCSVVSQGTPWNMANGGGLEVVNTTTVYVAPGSGAVDVSDCMPFGSTCTMTGATASIGNTPLSNAVQFLWNNANAELSVSGTGKVKAKTCTATNPVWTATYQLKTGSDLVGIR